MVVEFEVIDLAAVNKTVIISGLDSPVFAYVNADASAYLDVTAFVGAVFSSDIDGLLVA